jgi:hypothetical protein
MAAATSDGGTATPEKRSQPVSLNHSLAKVKKRMGSFEKQNRNDVRIVRGENGRIGSVVRRVGGRNSHPGFHRVRANIL